jgi:small-conductance mechanosensitive channel
MLQPALFEKGWFLWGTALVIGFPLLVVVLGEIAGQLARRGSPVARPLRLVRNVALPLAVVALFLRHVVGRPSEGLDVRLTASAAWVVGFAASLGLLTAALFSTARPGSRRAKAPRLFVDLLRVALVVVAVAVVLGTVWGADLGTLVAALGIGGIAVGLALQDTLSSLMAGMALLSEATIARGDWIEVEGVEGRVLDINWRTVRLETGEGDLVIIPNTVFGTTMVRNNSRPRPHHVDAVSLRFSYDDPPTRVQQVLGEVVASTPGVLADPEPVVRTVEYRARWVGYEVEYEIERYEDLNDIRSAFLSRVWYAAQRHGLTIGAISRREADLRSSLHAEARDHQRERFARNLSVPGDAMVDLFDRAGLRHFAAGETIVGQGQACDGLGLLISGRAVAAYRAADGSERDVVDLASGEFFGDEVALGAGASPLSFRAVTDVEVVVLEPAAVADLARRSARFGSEIEAVRETRRAAVDRAMRAEADVADEAGRAENAGRAGAEAGR